MKSSIALQRYLDRHIEQDLPPAPPHSQPWRQVLVVPAYRESPELLSRLSRSLQTTTGTLVILVVNRPEGNSGPEENTPLRTAIQALPQCAENLYRIGANSDLYCHDLERLSGPTSRKQGIGLARKAGCDLALKWQSEGAIKTDWIACTDADATLPRDYFQRLAALAPVFTTAVFPFWHQPGKDELCDAATALYELRLHHYVLGLEYAGSPYAFHSLGSSLAIRPDVYAQVRGFPRRAGGEDFYLLNKASKIGPVARLDGEAIAIESRASGRVPFGTGPAVAAIGDEGPLENQARFYHPRNFQALGALLASIPALQTEPSSRLAMLLADNGLDTDQAGDCVSVLQQMDLESALDHCRRQGRSAEQFIRHFQQWFDAFRTLKFLHGMRDRGWPNQSLEQLAALEPGLWPAGSDTLDIDALRLSILDFWGWQINGH